MIAFTIDVDWAHEEVIIDTLALFEQYNVKCTIFSTHRSNTIINCNRNLFEIAIHPNFNPLITESNKSVEDVIDELLEIHPNANGVRSHSLMQSTYINRKFADKGILYDSNILLPYQHRLTPFRSWNGMIRIPYNWEDDVHWSYGFSFEDSQIDLNSEGLNVFDFHPIHIYLNNENEKRYSEAKKYNSDPAELIKLRNTKSKGTRDLLVSLLEKIQAEKLPNKLLNEIASDFNAI